MAVFYNQANLSYNGGNTNSNIVTGEILEVLSVTKTAVDPTYSAGDPITYVIRVVNSGSAPISDITLTDNLGAYTIGSGTAIPLTYIPDTITYYIGGVLQSAPSVTVSDTLTISGIDVPAGGNAIIIYSASANETAPLPEGSSIVNTVTVTGNGITAPITATATVSAAIEPVLTISKGINPTVVTENSRITYTFTIRNLGNRAATSSDSLVVTDTFEPVLENIVVTINSVPVDEGTAYNYNTTTGLFSTIAGVVNVPAAEFIQDPQSGEWTVTPGTTVITVTGTV